MIEANYISNEKRGAASIGDSEDVSMRRLKGYILKDQRKTNYSDQEPH